MAAKTPILGLKIPPLPLRRRPTACSPRSCGESKSVKIQESGTSYVFVTLVFAKSHDSHHTRAFFFPESTAYLSELNSSSSTRHPFVSTVTFSFAAYAKTIFAGVSLPPQPLSPTNVRAEPHPTAAAAAQIPRTQRRHGFQSGKPTKSKLLEVDP